MTATKEREGWRGERRDRMKGREGKTEREEEGKRDGVCVRREVKNGEEGGKE